MARAPGTIAWAFLLLAACAGAASAAGATAASPAVVHEPSPSTYRPLPRRDLLVAGATVLDGAGRRHDDADILIRDGRIAALGRSLARPAGVEVVEAKGRWVTPGLVDLHTHNGTFALPYGKDASDISETSDFNAADTWIEHAVRPQDPAFARALAGGVTTLQILPGSVPLFGGRTVVVKPVPAVTVQEMKFPGAAQGLKISCGENPKSESRFPTSRMGVIAGLRRAFAGARQHLDRERDGERRGPPSRHDDMKVETLAAALRGELPVHLHCYRADDIAAVLGVAREFGFRIAAVHHAAEAYKIAPLLRDSGACVALWADWWGFKREAEDGIRENAALVDAAGGCAAMHSDIPLLGSRLNIEAAKAAAAGRRAGLDVPPERAIRWITSNPARALGLDTRIGTIEPGKNADLVIWSGDPFSIYTKADQVFIDGALAYDRRVGAPPSDFELGRPAAVAAR